MHQVTPKLLEEPLWLEIARRELGVHETPGVKHTARILQYHAATKLHASSDEVAWCAAFVSWCYEQAGIRHLRSARAADWARFGKATYLEPGALIVLSPSPGLDNANSGHVTFLVGLDGDQLVCLGGNQGDAVRISRYPSSRLVACRWPA